MANSLDTVLDRLHRRIIEDAGYGPEDTGSDAASIADHITATIHAGVMDGFPDLGASLPGLQSLTGVNLTEFLRRHDFTEALS